MCTYRLCKASYTLILSLSFFLFPPSVSASYNPPYPPRVEFVFNSESEATLFSDTECDSNSYSWYSIGMGCAIGDPSNVTCTVSMKYYNTDVNYCQGAVGPAPPPNVPDPIDYDRQVDGNGDNNYLLNTLQKYTQIELASDLTSQTYLSNIENSSRTSATLLKSILRTSGKDDGGIISSIIASDSNARDRAEKLADKDFLTPYLDRAELRDINFQRDNLQSGGSAARYSQEIAYDHLPKINQTIKDGNSDIEFTMRRGFNSLTDTNNWLDDIDVDTSLIATQTQRMANKLNTMRFVSGDDNKLRLLVEDSDVINSLNSQTTSLTTQLEQIIEKSQSETDNFNAKAAQLQAALDAIRSNTSGGGTGGDGGEGGEGDSATENACSSFTCSSQTPACYLARKQWETDCASQAALTDSGALGTFKTELTGFLEHADSSVENIDAGTVDTSSFMSKYTDGSGFSASSASCPAPYTVNIVITTITLDLTPFCDLANVIRWFLIAFSSVAAGLMVAKYS
jgi:transcriptional regulator with XRE-family HTH domain